MISKRQMALIALAAIAGFALTMGGWTPVAVSYVAGAHYLGEYSYPNKFLNLSAWSGVGFAAVAAFLVLRRPD